MDLPSQDSSALLLPVPEAEPAVEPRARHDLPGRSGITPHITLLTPFLPPEQIDTSVVERLARLFRAVEPFCFRLAETGRFPGVVYLAPEPMEPFERIIAALVTLFPEFPPYGGTHRSVVPHLTIGHDDDPRVLEEIEEAVRPALPIQARASEAWLMDHPGGPWSSHWRFRLG